MADDAVVDRTSKKVRIIAHIGDDIIQRMIVRRNGVLINDWGPYTITTTLKDFSADLSFNWAVSTGPDGAMSLSLTDAQTTTMAPGEYFGSLAIEQDGERITRMSITLEMRTKEDEEG